jgi:hypothetical protein
MPRRNGPGAFLASVGAVIAFLGLLTFLAVPAARQLDEKDETRLESGDGKGRQKTVVLWASATALVGSVMVAAGWAMVRKRG